MITNSATPGFCSIHHNVATTGAKRPAEAALYLLRFLKKFSSEPIGNSYERDDFCAQAGVIQLEQDASSD
jgi:hypothetical protein